MSPSPKIAVVIPHYNPGNYFPQAFNSLIAQSETQWECVIVDDASTDGSWEKVKAMVSTDARFILAENRANEGAAASFEKAIGLSQAGFFARLDPDDTLAPDALEKVLQAHADHPHAGLIYSNHFVCDDKLNIMEVHHAKQIDDLTSEESFLYYGEISQFASFRREIFEKTEGVHKFNKRAEDVDIYLKMCEVAPVKHLDLALYNYRHHAGSRRQFENKERARFWYWVAAIKMAERRGLNIEDFFVKHCARRRDLNVYLEREERIKSFINNNPVLRTAYSFVQKYRLIDTEKYLSK